MITFDELFSDVTVNISPEEHLKHQENINKIHKHFKENKNALGRIKRISPDRNSGENYCYSVSCDKGRYYTVLVRGEDLEIHTEEL